MRGTACRRAPPDARAHGMERPVERLVIVGGGMAAGRLIDELQQRAPRRYEIAVLAAEAGGIYNRILLSSVVAGEKSATDSVTHTPAWCAHRGIAYQANTLVTAVDRTQRLAITPHGAVPYDRLVLATGSRPIILPLPGVDLPGVLAFRDLANVERLLRGAAAGRRAVVIGGGLLGLEAAAGLARRGVAVTVLHLMPHLMERQLDADAASLLRDELAGRGIDVRLGAHTATIEGGETVEGVRLTDGTVLPADLVVMAVGVRPNADLARASGLDVGRGVVVDDTLATSDPAISALGECIEHRGQTFGLVAPIWEQAKALAQRLAGDDATYAGSVSATSLKVSGVALYSAGDHIGDTECETITLRDRALGSYRKLVLRNDRLAGAVLYGDATDGNWYLDLITSGVAIGPMREALVFGRRFAEVPACEIDDDAPGLALNEASA